MKTLRFVVVALASSLFLANSSSVAVDHVIKIHLKGSIDPATLDYVKSGIKKSKEQKAKALVIELDTPGGLVSSVKEMAQAIDEGETSSVVHVVPAGASATSAGALLALASHLVVMAEGTHIGAAHPVGEGGKEIQGVMGEKATNDTAAFARGLAEKRGRDVKVAEIMVTQSKSYSAQEAKAVKLSDLTTSNLEEILKELQTRKIISDAKTVVVETLDLSLSQKLLHFLADPNVAGLLLSFALLCIYIEVSSPGISLPGIVGTISLILAFMSFQMLPIQLGGLLLLILGAVFLIAEFFVTSHGLLAIGGSVSFVLGLIWVIDPARSDLVVSPVVWIPIGLVLMFSALGLAWIAASGKRLNELTRNKIGGGDELGLSGYDGIIEMVNPDQKTGKLIIRGETWDFQSEELLSPNHVVKVIGKKGFHLIVQRKTN